MVLIIKFYIIKVILKKQNTMFKREVAKLKKGNISINLKECVVVPNENI